MLTDEKADVVVVGARAAGAATAMLLARAGFRVVVIDRERPGADTLSTHALMRGAVMQLQRWGLLEPVRAAGTPAIRESTFHYAAETVRVPIKEGAGVDALYAPRRTVLDPILVEAACAAGAVVRHGTTLTGVVGQAGRITGVEVGDRAGRRGVISCRLVIGADGRGSTLARVVGAPVTHAVRDSTTCAYGYVRGVDRGGYEWAYRPTGMAGFIPTNDGATCVFVAQRCDRPGPRGRSGLMSAVGDAAPSLAERLRTAELVSPVRTFIGLPGRLRRPWGPGWALVGDAGSWKDPISAHGLTDALRDAELLARAATRALRGDETAETAFGSYEATRDRLTLPILEDSAEIAAMRWDDDRIRVLLRRLNLAMNAELETIRGFDPVPATVGGAAGL